MSKVEITSKRFRLNAKDYLKGLAIAVGSAAIVFLQAAILTGEINWEHVGVSALSAGLVYLAKNWMQPAQKKQNITDEEVDELKNDSNSASK